jgi:hypothetical protein
MLRGLFARVTVAAFVLLIVAPAVVSAQSGIAGVVKDTTGAVLPGVTVEATSDALIEKVRSVTSDGQGQYKIIDLRPGVYAVTFSLPGFSAVKREGIELITNFTATVNSELKVGSVEETVTVSGASPVVDVQNVIQQRVVNKEIIDTLPTGRTEQTVAALIPGISIGAVSKAVTQDVGGSAGDMRQTLAIHGGRQGDFNELIDGVPQNAMTGLRTGGINMDTGAVQEFSYELASKSAERTTGGVSVNSIPKDGGNRFSGTFFGSATNHSLQTDNTTDQLIAKGLKATNHLYKVWDLNPSVGGPITKNRLWFFASTRYWGYQDNVAGMFYNKTPAALTYTPDLERQALDDSWLGSVSLRTTWQINQKSKLAFFVLDQGRCLCHQNVSATTAPEASRQARSKQNLLTQGNYTAPITTKFLVEAAAQRYKFWQQYDPQESVTDQTIAIVELSTGLNYRAPQQGWFRHPSWIYNYKAAVSYVTGSHAFRTGFTLQRGKREYVQRYYGNVVYQFLNGAPRSLIQYATPYTYHQQLDGAVGLFVQDQWTLNRITVNAGLRFDYHRESVPEEHLPAVDFLGPRDFPAIENIPNWKDLNPRLGVSWDVRGNGKTALKASISRYVAGEVVETSGLVNPVNTSVNSASRPWTDSNRNNIPDCDLRALGANGECGPLNNVNFGKSVIATRYDDAYLRGRGVRGYNWETSFGMQHEVMRQVSLSVEYFRRWYGNFLVTENQAVTAANFDPYCVTAPADPRLPGGGGYAVCGLYDVAPARLGQVNNFVTFADKYGKQFEHYNGVDITTNARLPKGAFLQGGVNIGRTETNVCDVVLGRPQIQFAGPVANVIQPRSEAFCDVKQPFQPQVKLLGSYPLPWWSLQTSATLQSVPGPQILASYVATNDKIAPSLGRNLASGAAATATIDLVPPGTMFIERLYQVDFRLAKMFRFGRNKVQANFDLYNALNASTILSQNNVFGPNWQQPTYILPGRLFKFGAQLDF